MHDLSLIYCLEVWRNVPRMARVFKGLIFSAADIFINSSPKVFEILGIVFTSLRALQSKHALMLEHMHLGTVLENTL